jgi:hypothetical protein
VWLAGHTEGGVRYAIFQGKTKQKHGAPLGGWVVQMDQKIALFCVVVLNSPCRETRNTPKHKKTNWGEENETKFLSGLAEIYFFCQNVFSRSFDCPCRETCF